ncbi:MAG: phosphatase PAP2 family protein [Candidatus Dormibacteraeota bacterium]|nr:phosphatase PAP2 family protein [Candidatus Dormibacteraeota bacterium]
MAHPRSFPSADRLDASTLRRHPRLLLGGSLVYLGLVFGVMLWRGIDIEPQWVVLALLVIAAALGRGKQFIFDFVPFLLLFLLYEVMRGFAAKTGFAPHDLSGPEQLLFGGALPTQWLQQAFYIPRSVGWVDLVSMGIYFLHFPLPVAVGFIFWLRDRRHYWHFVWALLLMSALAFVTYLFFPSTPPWLQYPGEVHKVTNETVTKLNIGYFISPVYEQMNPNQYAAFPSLHASYPVLAAVYAWRRYRLLALALAVWSAAVWFSIVYLGEHYVVDALFGLLYVAGATAALELGSRHLRRRAESKAARIEAAA